MAKPKFYDLNISGIRQDTSDSIEISFEIPKKLKPIFDFFARTIFNSALQDKG
jgi:hypothetical protein